MTSVEVQFISAKWCKKCVELKPDAIQLCSIAGITMTIIDFDELDEIDELDELDEFNEIKHTIKTLPTIRMKTSTDSGSSVWKQYTAHEFDMWKSDLLQNQNVRMSSSFTDDNF